MKGFQNSYKRKILIALTFNKPSTHKIKIYNKKVTTILSEAEFKKKKLETGNNNKLLYF